MNTRAFHWLILIVLALIWGSSFILMKRGLDVFSSDEVAALRIFIAFIVMLPLVFFRTKKEDLRQWKGLLGQGMLGNFIPAFLFTKAETGLSSALTGMLNSLTPVFTLLLGFLLFKTRSGWINALGIMAGFAGAIGLLWAGKDADFGNNLGYGTYVIIATICYALSVHIIKKYLQGMDAITSTTWAMCMIGPPAGTYLLSTDFLQKLQHPLAIQSLAYVAILAIFGTAISVVIFTILVKQTNALFASSVTYLIPIVAILWGLLDGERLGISHLAWIGLVLLGVYLVNKKTA